MAPRLLGDSGAAVTCEDPASEVDAMFDADVDIEHEDDGLRDFCLAVAIVAVALDLLRTLVRTDRIGRGRDGDGGGEGTVVDPSGGTFSAPKRAWLDVELAADGISTYATGFAPVSLTHLSTF